MHKFFTWMLGIQILDFMPAHQVFVHTVTNLAMCITYLWATFDIFGCIPPNIHKRNYFLYSFSFLLKTLFSHTTYPCSTPSSFPIPLLSQRPTLSPTPLQKTSGLQETTAKIGRTRYNKTRPNSPYWSWPRLPNRRKRVPGADKGVRGPPLPTVTAS